MWLGISCFGQHPYRADYKASLQNYLPHQTDIFGDSTEWSDPKKATVLALVLPGAGQIYNKKYWKAAIVYAGIGGLAYMFKYNQDSLNKYQTVLVSRLDTSKADLLPDISESFIRRQRDDHRRLRDISILGFVGLYALQAIDANVDAHLKEFKVNEDLSMRISPDIYAIRPGIGRYNGMTVSLRF